MSVPSCLRVAALCAALVFVLAGLPRWSALSAADVEEDVDLTLRHGGGEFTNSVGMKFVLVRAGKFMMGAPQGEPNALPDEQPQHEVTLTKDYYLGIHEVTQKQYEKVMGKNPSAYSKTGASAGSVRGMDTSDFPVDNVTYEEAKDFCTKLNALAAEKGAARKYHLPTEAEWEYACRGGHKISKVGKKSELPFHFDAPSASLGHGQANFDSGSPEGGGKQGPALNRTCKVGSYKANVLGIHDMHANLWEWCSDWYSPMIYNEKNRKDPTGPNNGSGRILRSGSHGNPGSDCRAARRIGYGANNRSQHVGFRVACSR